MRSLLFAVVFAFLPAFIQQPPQNRPGAPETPVQANTPKDAPLNPALPTLFIVGDSTARNGADLGWGDHFAQFFDTSKMNVANRAKAGRSSRTYINEGLWRDVLAEMKPGDFVLIQMGHNDGGDLGGAKPRGTLKGVGEETQEVPQTVGYFAGKTETVYTFGWYLRKYIVDARAKHATPILLTTTVRNIWTPGPDGKQHIEHDMGYNTFIRTVGQDRHVPVLDMASVEADRLEALGPEKTAALFPKDHTHTSAEGANLAAQSVADVLRSSGIPLSAYLLAPAAVVH